MISPAPIVLASVTSSVVSIVNEDGRSTSAGAIPASRSAATTASDRQLALRPVDLLGELVCPIPTMAAVSRSGVGSAAACARTYSGSEHHGKRER